MGSDETGSEPCRSVRWGLGGGGRWGWVPGWVWTQCLHEVSKQPDNARTDRKPAKKRKKSPISDPCIVKRVNIAREEAVNLDKVTFYILHFNTIG